MIDIKSSHFHQLNSEMVKDSVEDTLSEIVNILQVTASAFCAKLESDAQEKDDLNVAELRGLHTILRTVRAASLLCAQSILNVQSEDEGAQQNRK